MDILPMPGTKVHYITPNDNKIYNGIVKSVPLDRIITEVFVVYNCDNNWNNYNDYNAARTKIKDLELGWIKKINFKEDYLIKKYISDAHTDS